MNLDNYPSSNTYNYPLIIECCKITPDLSKLESLASQITDWDKFIDSAYAHGIFPLVAKSLKSIPNIPQSAKILLKTANIDIAQHNMQKSAELVRVVKLLQDAGIAVLAIKGPVLSQMVYGNIIDRQFSDLDIVIDQTKMYDAVEMLIKSGYMTERPIDFLRNQTLINVAKDFTLIHNTNGIPIEIHWRLFLEKQAINGNIQLFSDEALRYPINNYNVPTLGLVTTLLYLLLHGSNHFWERLEWITDIDRLIRNHYDGIEWGDLIERAERMEIEELIYLGLWLAHVLFATPIDPRVLVKISGNTSIESALGKIIDNIYNNSITKPSDHRISMDTLKKMGLLKDNHNRWVRQYLLTIFKINELDIYEVNLPPMFHWLYYPIRIFRLVKLNLLRMQPKSYEFSSKNPK